MINRSSFLCLFVVCFVPADCLLIIQYVRDELEENSVNRLSNFHNNDNEISVDELWKSWRKSEGIIFVSIYLCLVLVSSFSNAFQIAASIFVLFKFTIGQLIKSWTGLKLQFVFHSTKKTFETKMLMARRFQGITDLFLATIFSFHIFIYL